MHGFRLLTNEMKCLAFSRLAWAFLLVTVGLGAVGINAVKYSNQMGKENKGTHLNLGIEVRPLILFALILFQSCIGVHHLMQVAKSAGR